MFESLKPRRKDNESLRDYAQRVSDWQDNLVHTPLIPVRIKANAKLIIISTSLFLFGLNVIFELNKSYQVFGTSLGSRDQYKLFIVSTASDIRSQYVAQTKINYFGTMPEWTINIFYILYLIIGIITVIFYFLRWNKRTKGASYGSEHDRLIVRLQDAKNKENTKDVKYYSDRLHEHENDKKYEYYRVRT